MHVISHPLAGVLLPTPEVVHCAIGCLGTPLGQFWTPVPADEAYFRMKIAIFGPAHQGGSEVRHLGVWAGGYCIIFAYSKNLTFAFLLHIYYFIQYLCFLIFAQCKNCDSHTFVCFSASWAIAQADWLISSSKRPTFSSALYTDSWYVFLITKYPVQKLCYYPKSKI